VTRALLVAAAVLCAAPVRAQTAEERFRSLPAEKQEDLRQKFRELVRQPNSSAPYATDGYTIPRAQTGSAVAIDDVINNMDPEARAAFTETLRQLGEIRPDLRAILTSGCADELPQADDPIGNEINRRDDVHQRCRWHQFGQNRNARVEQQMPREVCVAYQLLKHVPALARVRCLIAHVPSTTNCIFMRIIVDKSHNSKAMRQITLLSQPHDLSRVILPQARRAYQSLAKCAY